MKATEATTDKYDLIPTGFPQLDSLLGIGGIASKNITEISGIWSVGKSTLALQVVASAQRQGRDCFFCDSEFRFSPTYATSLGVDCEKLDFVQEQYAETSLDLLEEWATSHKNGFMVLDSIGQLLPREEAEKGAESKSIGLQARLIGSFTRRIVPILSINNHALLLINHSFTDLTSGRLKTSGGAKLEYAKSVWLTLKRSYGKPAKRSGDGKKTVLFLEAEIRKNKLAPTEGMKCELEMIPGQGFLSAPLPEKKRGRPKNETSL